MYVNGSTMLADINFNNFGPILSGPGDLLS
jgi:hypothetical protein